MFDDKKKMKYIIIMKNIIISILEIVAPLQQLSQCRAERTRLISQSHGSCFVAIQVKHQNGEKKEPFK